MNFTTDNSSWKSTVGTESWSISVELSTGKNILYIRATDVNGNLNYEQIELTVLEEETEGDNTANIIAVAAVFIIILIILAVT